MKAICVAAVKLVANRRTEIEMKGINRRRRGHSQSLETDDL